MTDPDAGKFRQQGWGQDLPSNQPVELCAICHMPDGEPHATRRHAFTPAGAFVDTSQFGPKRSDRRDEGRNAGGTTRRPYSTPQQPFDPVLRKALIDKGIITFDDLDRASREIKAFTQAVTGGYDAGTGTSTIRSDAPEPGVRKAE